MDIDSNEPKLHAIPPAGIVDVLQWEPANNQRLQWALDEICGDCQSDDYIDGKKYHFRHYAVKKGWRFKSEKFLSLKFECYIYRAWHIFEEHLNLDNYRQSYDDRSPLISDDDKAYLVTREER